jgi:hypothetical protein
MKSNISISTQTYFGDHFYYTGWVLLIVGIPIMIDNWYIGLIALLIGAIVTTSSYKLVIDLSSKQIEDYLFILGMKRDRIIKEFSQLKKVTIKSSRYSQQLSLRAVSTVIEGTMYSVYLVTDSENFFLGESKNKLRIERKALKIAASLGVEFTA